MRLKGKLVAGLLAFLSVLYLAQAASPLRLNTDSVVFLSMAASAVDGHGFLYQGSTTHFPRGYPAIVAAMDYAGIASSSALVLLNCLFIAFGLLAALGIMRGMFGFERDLALLVCAFTLLSFVLVKHMSIPLTDAPFFGVAMPCLYFTVLSEKVTGRKKWAFVMFGAILALVAISIRSIGVALLLALGWAVIPKNWMRGLVSIAAKYKGRSILIAALVLVAIAVPLIVILGHTTYIQEALDVYANGHGLRMISTILSCRFEEWGELTINMPVSKLPASLGAVMPLVGLVAFCVAILAIWQRRRSFGALEIYLLGYSAILFIWPYKDTRFWLPVFTLFAIFIANSLQRLRGIPAMAVTVYLILFSCAGFSSISYSTRLTFSGSRFPELYGDAQTRAIYQKAFGQPTDEKLVIPEWLFVLKRYHPGTVLHSN